MCGILGYIAINSKLVSNKKFDNALKLMEHRGPDNHDILKIDNILLGHRRLSIIDVSSSSNMPFQDNNLVITYNGEIFNYIEIKESLIKKGYKFKTDSDTEVILKSYQEWGYKFLKKFNGMFAFFIYDLDKEIGFGARDRFGIKPFYYHSHYDKFIFSSEIKPILEFDIKPTVNTKYLNTYITNSALDYGSGSLIEQINQLEAGQYFTIKNEKILFTNWWTNDDLIIELPDSLEERIKLYRSTLSDSIRIRLRSDVNSAMTLSGGMDSTSIYSIYRKEYYKNYSKKSLDIFTIKYGKQSGIDEVDDVKK